ncbi:MAG TPA: glycosyltransferase family 87 protein [Vicinamibacterales bacterium]
MRDLVGGALGGAGGIFAYAAGAGLTGSRLAAALISAAATALIFRLVRARRMVTLDETACFPALKIVSALATVAALVQLTRLAIFIVDPAQVASSFIPASKWEAEHSCLSAYFVAAQAAPATPNVYDDALYSQPNDDPSGLRKARMLGPFKIDVFEYPPPFLLLPRALLWLTSDFLRFRMLWFALNGGVVLIALLAVARALGPAAGTRALLLSPLVWVALPTISNLQKGNVQGMVIALSMLAMVLFERRRFAAGGILLAFVTASKLYPGLLVVYLLVRRRWKAVAWTAAAGAALAVLTLIDLGWAAYAAFLEHLPGLLGGEAFPAFRNPAATAINFSIPGLVFKLKLFGLPGMGFGAMKIVGWVYTLVALAAVVFAARRRLRDDEQPLVWLAILILATLRSPFLPQAYAAIPPLWLLTLMAAGGVATARTTGATLAAWLALNIYWPTDWVIDPRLLATLNVVPQTVTIIVAAMALRASDQRSGTASTSEPAAINLGSPFLR